MSTTTVIRVAHACVLLDFDGHRILTDPWFSERLGYYQGESRAFDSAADLPPLAGVVVSHGHYDHFDLDAFAAYPDKSVPLLVKRGLGVSARRHGFINVTELDSWQSSRIGPLTVTATPARHKVPEVTYVIEGAGRRVFFGADTLRIAELAGWSPSGLMTTSRTCSWLTTSWRSAYGRSRSRSSTSAVCYRDGWLSAG